MNETQIIDTSVAVTITAQCCMVLLILAGMMVFLRIFKGPGLSDRVVAIDFLTFIVVSFIGTLAIYRNDARYLDLAIILAVIAFLATVSFARYIERVTAKQRHEQRREKESHD